MLVNHGFLRYSGEGVNLTCISLLECSYSYHHTTTGSIVSCHVDSTPNDRADCFSPNPTHRYAVQEVFPTVGVYVSGKTHITLRVCSRWLADRPVVCLGNPTITRVTVLTYANTAPIVHAGPTAPTPVRLKAVCISPDGAEEFNEEYTEEDTDCNSTRHQKAWQNDGYCSS